MISSSTGKLFKIMEVLDMIRYTDLQIQYFLTQKQIVCLSPTLYHKANNKLCPFRLVKNLRKY